MKKPVRMKKLKIVLHKDKKENVLRRLLDDGSFQLENVEVEGLSEKGKQTAVTIEAMSLVSRINEIKGIFGELGIKVGEEEGPIEKVQVTEKSSEETLKEIGSKVESLEGNIKQLYSRLHELKAEREGLENQLRTLKVLEKLNIDYKDVHEEYKRKYVHTYVAIGSVATDEMGIIKQDISKLTKDFAFFSHTLSDTDSLIFLVSMKKHAEEIAFILNLHTFKKLELLEELKDFEPHDALIELKERIANLELEEKSIFRELKDIAFSEKENLNVLGELLALEKKLDEIMTLFGRTVETYVIYGWVPVDSVYRVSNLIREEAEGLCTIEAEDPAKKDLPPTLVKNPKFAQPLEVITGAYGTPAYDEYDPTSIVTITFPLIFGFMFGDVGQGIIIALVGYYIGFKLIVEETVKKAGKTIMLCGVSATFVGFLYGAVFSIEGLFEPLWLSPVHAASTHMNTLLGASLKLGVLILSIAMLAQVANEISHHKRAEAIVDKYGLAGIWLLIGGAIMISRHGTDLAGIVGDVFLFIPLVVLPVLVIMLGAWKIEGEPFMVSAVDAVFEALVKFLVNTISFMRIAILAIIHGALSLIMVGVIAIMPPTTMGTVGKAIVFVIMNIIIIVMELFVSFIQTMRLHYYEIFSKFYSGTGRTFNPLKFVRKYTVVDKKI
jgi:V/A-type H+-transporting ATPase subunit I